MSDALLHHIRGLEERLHRQYDGVEHHELAALLHPEFLEFGRSGRSHDRATVLGDFERIEDPPRIEASRYALAVLGEDALADAGADVVLLTYRSCHLHDDGTRDRYTLRASVWVRMASGWQMRFHQGTATDAP